MLSETSLEHFDFHGWSNALIENVVNRVEYRHVHVVVTIDFLDTLCAVVSFGNHLHFELGGLDGITLSNHGAEHAVSGEVGIHGNEQVAQIDGVGDAPFAWLHALIEVDGGVNATTSVQLAEAGTDVLVAGSFVFGAENPEERIDYLRNL